MWFKKTLQLCGDENGPKNAERGRRGQRAIFFTVLYLPDYKQLDGKRQMFRGSVDDALDWFVVFPFIIRCPTRNHRPVCNGIIHWRATDGALLRQEWCVGALGAVLCMHCGFRAVGKRATFSEKRKERREKEDKT
ncbi:MAG: hypothetical protein MR681_04450 [Prevotella sp.]|nr:hypothetical protein [Prevotella sp.]